MVNAVQKKCETKVNVVTQSHPNVHQKFNAHRGVYSLFVMYFYFLSGGACRGQALTDA